MSKRRLVIYISAALLLSTAIFAYLQISPYKAAIADSDKSDSLPDPLSGAPNRRPQELRAPGKVFGADSPIPASMSPEQAYADAYSILRCTHAANSDLNLPEDMTDAQKKEFEKSRVAGLDCSALESEYSAYDLAKYAAERGNVQAQLDFSAIAASVFNEEKNALDPKLITQYKSDSLKYLNMAAAAGNADAYARLAENYRTGLFSDKDRIRAYAYAYANNQLTQSNLSKLRVDQFSHGLSANELLQAQQQGQSFINRK